MLPLLSKVQNLLEQVVQEQEVQELEVQEQKGVQEQKEQEVQEQEVQEQEVQEQEVQEQEVQELKMESSYPQDEEGEDMYRDYEKAVPWDLDTLDFNFASGQMKVLKD